MTTITARLAPGVAALPAEQWDALSQADGSANPFVSHAFLAALERSASVGPGTGWAPAPICIDGAAEVGQGRLAAAMPAYIKHHSQGEYVFDHAWADAWAKAGGAYYPKLQIAVPFTPATGPRLLTRDRALARPLIAAAEQLCLQAQLSSAHATFLTPADAEAFADAGWLPREDLQFHWQNQGFASFDDFLATLASAKRKTLRKERAAAQAGVTIRALTGADLSHAHWDAFWQFYQDTGARKWGHPYLTREAFTLLGETMAERILLILAWQEARPIAGALNFIGGDTLYGRYWGALVDKPFLHFELCYYQAIDWAIRLGLARVEAGAQGGHKLMRGYAPVRTRSAHYIADPRLRAAIADFLARERRGVAGEQAFLAERLPFKRGDGSGG